MNWKEHVAVWFTALLLAWSLATGCQTSDRTDRQPYYLTNSITDLSTNAVPPAWSAP